ncbi:MAG: ATP-binding protein [Desulfuromonadia bacterium]
MPLLRSIRVVLTLWYSVTLAAILVLYSVFLYLTIRAQLYAKTDQELLQIADSVASSTFDPFRDNPSSALDQVLKDFLGERYAGKMVQLVSNDGKILFTSELLEGATLPFDNSLLHSARRGVTEYDTTVTVDMKPIRFIMVPVLDHGKLVSIVQIGAPLGDEAEFLAGLRVILWLSIPLSIVALGGGGWFLAGRALKPVDDIAQSAELIDDRTLSARLVVVNPDDEIGRLTQAFNRTLDRLEAAFRRTKRFSVDVSHELRTPLTILKGETEVGLRWAKEPGEFREILENNLEEINRMSGIIESLLDLARIEEGRQRISLDPLELSSLVGEVFSRLMPDAVAKGVNLSFEPATDAFIRGDQQRIGQIVTHLVTNGIRFTPSGGRVTLSVETTETSVHLNVMDTGIGIPPEDLPFIFDRFYRVDSSRNRSAGGSGLGLSLVKTLVDAHGAQVVVKSEPGMGSRFTVIFPRYVPPCHAIV